MALIGVLSVMLLHEQMVRCPSPAVPTEPQRVVMGSAVLTGARLTERHAQEAEGAAALT
jgi:hypothetical protein